MGRAAWAGVVVLAIATSACRSTNVERARAIRENDRARSPLVEDRTGTTILKALLLPVAAIFGGGVPAERDPARVSLMINDSHSNGWSAADDEIFRRRVEAEWNSILERVRASQTTTEKSEDR
ncbi:MAG: hypothetical protein HYR85_00550 [Planctomycetes bacterium]|nr:hypothetical protein [Planctomycetota bacterium]MBI3847525.1 hypothetical protein [Planctomycetota bacterium]